MSADSIEDAPTITAPEPMDPRRVIKTSDTVALQIVHDIKARRLTKGDRLPSETSMLQEYRVSRGSLREAFRLLEVQGLIRFKPGPGGGPIVGSVEPENLARTSTLYFHLGGMTYGELFSTQELFEPLCARLACANPDRRERMAPFLRDDVPVAGAAYHASTVRFHEEIHDMADNKVLALYTAAVTHLITTDIMATMDPAELFTSIAEEHRQLAQLIADGDADRAERLMAEHFKAQHDYCRERWPARLDELIEWR
jgi:GntR family transcriptional repressor for pyruvate dehydrogenase complex